ncbi:enoyl-CoA hydratase/isomerase family protein [Planosporangium flavigriseum]|nr:enoyl-CoA hydratase/isomerase family protein [Planosporangium flavigriseum]NJC65504.1 enoyl-CoA hydratase/isomerase family protein [Planosporangium flavigriseum]
MKFEEYANKYDNIRMSRVDGILEVVFHTDGGPLQWGHFGGAHTQFADAFADIARDPENRIVIMAGTGDVFSGPPASEDEPFPGDAQTWDEIFRTGTQLTTSLLNIDALVISCINGPAYRHPEVALLADIVLAADGATIVDSAHFPNRVTPGDGMNLVMPLLMGYNRGRYFLLTGQTLDAREAHSLGLVNEVMPREDLMPRARELAAQLNRQNSLVIRYTRRLFTHPLKRAVHDVLGYGLALEGLAYIDERARVAAGQGS